MAKGKECINTGDVAEDLQRRAGNGVQMVRHATVEGYRYREAKTANYRSAS